jgi:hypothetical protein
MKNNEEMQFHANSSPNFGNQINLFDNLNLQVPVENNAILQNMNGKIKILF